MSSTQEIPIVYPQLDPPSSSSSYAETGQWGAPSKPQDPSSIGLGVVGPHESASYPPTAPAPAPAPATANPYITASPASGFTGKSPMNIITEYTSKWKLKVDEVSKKAEEAAGNVWQHLKTGPSMAETALGKLSQGTKLFTEGGLDKVFKQNFETLPEEELRKTYACFLSTSSGPVLGTLYISTKKIAFCSDRPLSYQQESGQTASIYYKVVVPLDSLQAANPSSNPNNAAEKYIEILTVDNHEFWFMGFVNYDKALRNLQEAAAFSN